MPAETIIFPPLLYLICALSAMSFVVAAGLWFYGARDTAFNRSVWRGQIHGFVWAMILSVALGQSFDILGEVIVLILALIFGRKHIQENLIFGGLCMAGWCATLGSGFVLFAFTGDLTLAVFFAGLLWLVPILGFYRERRAEEKVYNYLWPILCAYLILLLPLMIQKNVNTEEWQERKYARPLRKA